DIRHKLTAVSDCAYLIVIGCQRSAMMAKRPLDSISTAMEKVIQRIEAAPAELRDELREHARELLSGGISPTAAAPLAGARPAPPTFAGLSFLLAAGALLLLFVLPPVAVVLAISAALIAIGAVVGAIAGRGARLGKRLYRARFGGASANANEAEPNSRVDDVR